MGVVATVWDYRGSDKGRRSSSKVPLLLPPSLPPPSASVSLVNTHATCLHPVRFPSSCALSFHPLPTDFPPTPHDTTQLLQGRDSTKGPRAPGRSNRDDETSSKYSHGTSKLSNGSTAAGEGVNGNIYLCPLYVCIVCVYVYHSPDKAALGCL